MCTSTGFLRGMRAKKSLCTQNGPLAFAALFKFPFFPRGHIFFCVLGRVGPRSASVTPPQLYGAHSHAPYNSFDAPTADHEKKQNDVPQPDPAPQPPSPALRAIRQQLPANRWRLATRLLLMETLGGGGGGQRPKKSLST